MTRGYSSDVPISYPDIFRVVLQFEALYSLTKLDGEFQAKVMTGRNVMEDRGRKVTWGWIVHPVEFNIK